jgi:hypothetical protein
MDDRLLERLFSELDAATSRIDQLAKVVYTNASALGILTKIVLGTILAVVGATIGLWMKIQGS